jgi:hypothetical protein
LYPNGENNPGDQLSGTGNLTILFDNMATSQLTQPIPVVVGQKIDLKTTPAPDEGQTQSWTIAGSPIGSYQLTENSAPPCFEITNPPQGCKTVTPPDQIDTSTELYWTSQGTYEVDYQIQLTDGTSATETAQFNVMGPTNVSVQPTLGPVETFDSDKGWLLICGHPGPFFLGKECITLEASATIPTYDGSKKGAFQWVQLLDSVTYDHVLESGHTKHCYYPAGLDTGYPYPYTKHDGSIVFDSPDVNLSADELQVAETFLATTYLEWDSNLPDSIPVALGSTSWTWSGVAANQGGPWALVSSTGPTAEQFEPSSNYPTWLALDSGAHQGGHPTCSK